MTNWLDTKTAKPPFSGRVREPWEDRVPRHMNGCGVCPKPKNWTNNNALQEKWAKNGEIYWFPDQGGYLELCRDHWRGLRAWLNGEPKTEPEPEPAAPTMKPLEAFA